MDFFKLIKSLDELLYEVMSWLLFYPVTLWRSVMHPVRSLHYAEDEMKKPEEERFNDTLNPPLFLFLTVILIHLVELAVAGQSEVVTSNSGFYRYVSDDTTLVVLRIILFGLVPLLLARRKILARGERVDRDKLRQPFYAQCYATTPFAILVGIASIFSRLGGEQNSIIGLSLVGLAFVWLGVIEVEYFRTRLETTRWRAFGHASMVMSQVLFVLALIGAGMN